MSLIGGFETMRNIVVVEAVSTGYNYIEDIYRRGYNPVEVQSKDDSPDLRECRKAGKNNRYRDIETIVETEDYQETLEKVRALVSLWYLVQRMVLRLQPILQRTWGFPGILLQTFLS